MMDLIRVVELGYFGGGGCGFVFGGGGGACARMISTIIYLLLHCCFILILLLIGFVIAILLTPNHLQATIVYCIYVYVNYSLLYHILCLYYSVNSLFHIALQ